MCLFLQPLAIELQNISQNGNKLLEEKLTIVKIF